MKRTFLILTAASVVAVSALSGIALADDNTYRGWCPRGGDGYGYGHGHMMRGDYRGGGFGMMDGPRMGRFMQNGTYDLQLTPERYKQILEGKMAWRGNPNIKVGEVTSDKDGNIIATIVTKDNSLVDTFKVDPKTGARTRISQ